MEEMVKWSIKEIMFSGRSVGGIYRYNAYSNTKLYIVETSFC
jgi:hypothetical protein